MAKKKKNKNRNNNYKIDWIELIPIIIAIAIVPLIVYMRVIPIEGSLTEIYSKETNQDFFSYYKSRYLIASIILGFFIITARKLANSLEIKKSNLYFPVSVYLFFVLLSTIFSEYLSVALNGSPDRYEGVFVLISYVALMFLMINQVKEERHVKLIINALMISAIIACTIGIFQFFGMDLFNSSIGKSLILPSQYKQIADSVDIRFGAYTIYISMYNTNNVGSYMAMLFPISFILFTYIKDNKYKIIMGAISCLMFANWIGCRSRAGLVGGGLAFVVLFLLSYKRIFNNIRYILPLFTIFILIALGMNSASEGSLFRSYGVPLPQSSIALEEDNNISETYEDKDKTETKSISLKDIQLKGSEAKIEFDDKTLYIVHSDENLHFMDENKEILPFVFNENDKEIKITDNRYDDFLIRMGTNMVRVDRGRFPIPLAFTEDGLRFVGRQNRLSDLEPAPTWGFEGRERIGSSRGYIWSRSIPLLKDSLIIGSGADTYVLKFPDDDYVAKMKYIGNPLAIVDKPHNVYLQKGINTGVVSLLAYLTLLVMYAFQGFRLNYKNENEDYYSIGSLCALVAVIGYSGAGLFNDSLLSVTPVFWGLLGLGIACNYYLNNMIDSRK